MRHRVEIADCGSLFEQLFDELALLLEGELGEPVGRVCHRDSPDSRSNSSSIESSSSLDI